MEVSNSLRRHRAPVVALTIVFAATRLVSHRAGVRFDANGLESFYFVGSNRRVLQMYDEFVSRYLYLYPIGWLGMSPTAICAYVAMCGYSVWLLARAIRRRRASPETITLLFIALTSVYVFLITPLTDSAENSRMRLLVELLVLAFVAGTVCQMTGLNQRDESPQFDTLTRT